MTDDAQERADSTRSAVDMLWLRYRERMFQRLDAVEQALAAARVAPLDEEQRAHAHREAHKLAGSLGTFGITAGTAPARAIEAAFEDAALPAIEEASAHARALRELLESR